MKVEHLFKIPIVIGHVNNWDEHKKDLLSMLGHLTYYEDKKFYSDFHTHEKNYIIPPYFEKLFSILGPTLAEFTQLYPKDYKIDGAWAQIYEKDSIHTVHNHGLYGYSAIFYASIGEDHQGTKFFAPFYDFWEGYPIECIPNVKEGDIIFFPSMLLHESTRVTTDSSHKRIIFSFNLKNVA